ncbi:hypothetical protein C8Q77DRAFT_143064 [Trametes polyzona]|nr:hypothetical protein C8Q77DRAFT_143064 [Trametes polyzona]
MLTAPGPLARSATLLPSPRQPMSAYIPPHRYQLLSALVGTLLFGCFATLYPISLWMLVYKHRLSRRGRYTKIGIWLFAIVTILFLLAIAHFVLLICLAFAPFTSDSAVVGESVPSESRSATADLAITMSALLATVCHFIGSAFMTYRVFIVWGRRRVSITLPIMLLLTTFAGITITAANTSDGDEVGLMARMFESNAFPLVISTLALTLLTNITLLVLLLGRLVCHGRMLRQYRVNVDAPAIHWKVARTVLRSEGLYCAAIIANLVAFSARSYVVVVTLNILPQLGGISFTLIITHTGFSEIMAQLGKDDAAERGSRLRWAAPVVDATQSCDRLTPFDSSGELSSFPRVS